MKKIALALCLILGLVVNSAFGFSDHNSIGRVFVEGNFSGTGFIFNKSGCLLTAGHVIGYNKNIEFQLGNSLSAKVTPVAVDPIKDIAVLCPTNKIIHPGGSWMPLQLGLLKASDIKKFQDVFVTITGFHLGINAFVSEIYKVVGSHPINSYPTKTMGWKVIWDKWHVAPVPGYSGSPLIHGQAVVGILTNCEGEIGNFKYCLGIRTNEIISFLKEKHIAFVSE